MSTGSGREKGTFFVHGNPGLIEILNMEARRAIVIHLLLGQHSHNKLVKSCLQNKGSDVNFDNNNTENMESPLQYKYVWNNEHVAAYQNALESDSVRSDLRNLTNELLSENVDINENLKRQYFPYMLVVAFHHCFQ